MRHWRRRRTPRSSSATSACGGGGGRPFRVGKTRNINNQAAGARRRLRSVRRVSMFLLPTCLKSKPSRLLDSVSSLPAISLTRVIHFVGHEQSIVSFCRYEFSFNF
ncbi:hypothetical protein GQ55_4G104900 [Panicum hallii var. hallii]|uniref:Uncharacterized protein n=1 Tax=Panicum hallii var. hallii TaxID=1504633 RepID=A0A2T7DX91_9POAL|nr:hypothetical protein GQ55_4G104900 [Panicum hallii var. hallii]